ncbi:MAG: adenylyl-sulfate kinase [Chitinophagaceae bacterium]|nr:adenylyl-sulfate kinase [Chitinophagaceae bacterium]
MIIQFCGLSGAGKTTLAHAVKAKLCKHRLHVEIIDGDEYRETLCKGLGFSKNDRYENIRRMAFVAGKLSQHGIISIICAINPYDHIRKEIRVTYRHVLTVHIDCSIQVLQQRDTKGLYRRAMLPDGHPEKISNLTGINDPFEVPDDPDLHINTEGSSPEVCSVKVAEFILQHIFHTRVIQLEFGSMSGRKASSL